jgi:hypothetical protein
MPFFHLLKEQIDNEVYFKETFNSKEGVAVILSTTE